MAQEKTRVLLILDCSNSMWDRWQSDAKIKVTQKVLLKFLDSVANQSDIEVALRVFGHLNKNAYGTRLEVPFEANNNYRIQSKIKTLVPQGGCTVTTALENSLNDFPATGASRNIILIITDGMDDCDGNICNVARQVQMSGVIVQTFILGIGNKTDFQSNLDCAGKFTYVANEEQYTETLYNIFKLSEETARVVVRVYDESHHLYETEVPVAFYDSQTHVVKYTTIYAMDTRYTPDTLTVDPLVSYDVTLFSQPPMHIKGRQFKPGQVNKVDFNVEQGKLRLRFENKRTSLQIPNYPVVVRQHGKQEALNVQYLGDQTAYLAGDYDVEVLSLPILKLSQVNVQGSANTDLTIPLPGVANIIKPKEICSGSIFVMEEGEISWVCDLSENKSTERVTLMPGEYQLVLKPQAKTDYGSVQTKRFQIQPGQQTNITF